MAKPTGVKPIDLTQVEELEHGTQYKGRALNVNSKAFYVIANKEDVRNDVEDGAKRYFAVARSKEALNNPRNADLKEEGVRLAHRHPEFKFRDNAGKIVPAPALKQKSSEMYDLLRAADAGENFVQFTDEKGMTHRGVRDAENRPTGNWVTYDEKWKVRQTASYKEGQLHGTFVKLNEKGHRLESGFYRDGQKDGQWAMFNGEGQRVEAFEFKAGKQVSSQEFDVGQLAAKQASLEKRGTLVNLGIKA